MVDPTRRFTQKSDHYDRFRPGYPGELLILAEAECGLTRETVVADVGSGTGILSELLLTKAARVLGVEPNAEMRARAESRLAGEPRFVSVNGRAEHTTIPDRSVDLVIAGQAFHWFEPNATKREFARILRPPGIVMLVWNEFHKNAGGAQAQFIQIMREFGEDYDKIATRIRPEILDEFFDGGHYKSDLLQYRQRLDLEGLKGRLQSCSFIPGPGSPRFSEMIAAVDDLYHTHQAGGGVTLFYDTFVFRGNVGGAEPLPD